MAARDEHRDKVSVHIVAFPQSGIVTSPGVAELLDEAIRVGANLVGGLDPAGYDGDIDGHLDVIFGIADRRGVGIDIHLHDGGLLGVYEIESIARRTKALGSAARLRSVTPMRSARCRETSYCAPPNCSPRPRSEF